MAREKFPSLTSSLRLVSVFPLHLPLISRLAVMQGRCITVEFSAALLSTFSILKVSPQSWVSLDYSLPSPGSPLIILFPLPQSLHLVELD